MLPEWIGHLPVMVIEFCRERNIELVPEADRVLFICPKIPERAVQDRLRSEIPSSIQIKWLEGLKAGTCQAIGLMLSQMGLRSISGKVDNRHLDYELIGNTEIQNDEIWDRVSKLLQADGFLTSWTIKVNGKVMVEYDAEIERLRSEHQGTRQTIISQDEILNLSISLNTQSVDEFIASL